MKHIFCALSLLSLSACATTQGLPDAAAPVDVRIIGLNDFHGRLDPPKANTETVNAAGEKIRVPSGGAAYLATAIDSLKAGQKNTVVVAAGDLIGASPLSSSLFLDEPAIMAMNLMGLEYNAIGNHEFDRGTEELLRIQSGGCEKHTAAEPCRLDKPFVGAKFKELAANTFKADGKTLFPPYAIKTFGTGKNKVSIGFIGMTLRGTGNLVSTGRIKGISFADEAETANALVPKLKAAGADVIVVLIHEGVSNPGDINNPKCDGVAGALTAILDRFDSRIDIVVSGHTHQSYVCDYANINKDRPILLTSAGTRGQLVTGIDLKIDPASGKLLSKSARNIIVQSEAYTGPYGPVPLIPDVPAFTARPDVAALVTRYRDAAKADETRIVGSLSGAATREKIRSGESLMGNLIADAQLAATQNADNGGAQIAFMNPDGIRAEIVPTSDGKVTFGSVFTAQPFANQLIVKSLTGAQIKTVLEEQFNNPNWIRVLSPSNGFRFGYDLSKPEGQRIVYMALNGVPLADEKPYRVAISDFLSNGGDLFSGFIKGANPIIGPTDLEAFIAYVGRPVTTALPMLDRVENLTPLP